MKVVIQRVLDAKVAVGHKICSSIGKGLLILLGIESSDKKEDIDYLCNKIANLRIFNDAHGIMNKSITDVGGDLIVVSQFTLYANTKKGNRPSYIGAAKPDKANPIYEDFVKTLRQAVKRHVGTGIFGANMTVQLTNDGPVTIVMDSKNK